MTTFVEQENIINSKNILLNKDLSIKSKFNKPHSVLNSIIKYEDEQKFDDENIRFNLKKYLKKEVEKDNNFINKDRKNS